MKTLLIASLAAMLIVPAVSVRAALIAHETLDTAANLTFPLPNNATQTNNAAVTTGGGGKLGEALSLDGTGDYAQVNGGNPLTGTGQRTYSVWFKRNAIQSTGLVTPISFGANSPNGAKWDFDIDLTNGGVEVGVDGGRMTDTGATFNAGQWYHVVSTLPVTPGSADDIRTYLDAALRTGTTVNNDIAVDTSAGTWRIGTATNNGGNGRANIQFLNGFVDDAAIWDEALTNDEIKGLFDVGNVIAYDAGEFDALKQVHDEGSGHTAVNGLKWRFANGLTGTNLSGGGAMGDVVVLNATAGTGVVVVPEPSAVCLLVLAIVGFASCRRSCVRQ